MGVERYYYYYSRSGKFAVLVLSLCLFQIFAAGGGGVAEAASVYKVGDSAGWTTIGNVDYKAWAATKSFQIGDVIVFTYNPQFHNVMQVKHPEYKSCNASAPIATHTTGNDSITITKHGHHFFLCGVPGHCQSGQKVDINVLRTPLAPTPSDTISPSSPTSPSTSPTTTTTSPATTIVPTPSASGTKPSFHAVSKLLGCVAVFGAFIVGFPY